MFFIYLFYIEYTVFIAQKFKFSFLVTKGWRI